MTLRLFNSLTRQKEEFCPLDVKNVRMYVCGPTVYDYAHIGNARPAIVFDVLYRLLRHLYGKEHVTYVRNITDVDDKINARAAERGISIRDLTEETYQNFKQDVKVLACLDPTHEPRATENIEQMIVLVQRLLDQRHAYVARGGEGREVLFDVLSMPDYGALSRRNLDEQIAGARVAVEDHKRNPEDFVLWKESDASEPGWDATFEISDENREELGLNSTTLTIHGRPGWHLECSAMSERYLWTEIEGRLSGKARAHPHQFDIHGGGIDLIFPHHENEIAQTRCAFGTEGMAQVWMHNGFLQVEGQKMSKSLGNFVTINEVLHQWPGEVARLAMLKTPYREPINWTFNQLEQAQHELAHWSSDSQFAVEANLVEIDRSRGQAVEDLPDAFLAALEDDLNTPAALTVIRRHAAASSGKSIELRQIYLMAEFLGLLRANRLGIHTGTIFGGALRPEIVELSRPLRAAVANGLKEAEVRLVTEIESYGSKVRIHGDGWVSIDSIDKARNEGVNALIAARSAARAAKNWAEADRIRDELAGMGIVLKDNPDGTTTWEVKR